MKRRVIWELPAVEQLLVLAKTDREVSLRIVSAVRRYAAGEWRLRVGDWRVIFTADPALNAVDILAILNRRDAYD